MKFGVGNGEWFNVHWWGMRRKEFEALMDRVRERHPEVWEARRQYEEKQRWRIDGIASRFLPPKPTREELCAALPSLLELGAPPEIQAAAEKVAGGLRFEKWRREAREQLIRERAAGNGST
jgi:hypothetical protein